MSSRRARRRRRASLTSSVLGALCVGGALAYAVVVGVSLATAPAARVADEVDTVGIIRYTPEVPQGILQVVVDDGEDGYERSLICRGSVEADPEACAVLGEYDAPFEEVAADAECTDSEYGPETARVAGHWDGEDVDAELSRVGSCEEARWQRVRPLTEPAE